MSYVYICGVNRFWRGSKHRRENHPFTLFFGYIVEANVSCARMRLYTCNGKSIILTLFFYSKQSSINPNPNPINPNEINTHNYEWAKRTKLLLTVIYRGMQTISTEKMPNRQNVDRENTYDPMHAKHWRDYCEICRWR